MRLAKLSAENNGKFGACTCGRIYEEIYENYKRVLEYYLKVFSLDDHAAEADSKRIKKLIYKNLNAQNIDINNNYLL